MNSNSNNDAGNKNKEQDDRSVDGHLKTVSNLAYGLQMMCAASHAKDSAGDSWESTAAVTKPGKKSCAMLGSNTGTIDKSGNKQHDEASEEDCDRSQSPISGTSLDGSKRGRRSSFRSRAAKIYSPKIGWMNQDHQAEDNSAVSFSMTKMKASASGHGNMCHESMSENHRDSTSQGFKHDTAQDDDGYLSHSTAEGYHSGGYHSSYYHPALSHAPSVKSDIATVCSGSVVEEIDMAEMASVASGPTVATVTNRESTAPQHKGDECASNVLNDMGPPAQLCSALLLAANAACRPSSRCSLRSFDTNSVVAHVDTVSPMCIPLFDFAP